VDEVCHALSVEHGKDELDCDNIPDIDDVITVCAGLVTVDVESNIVRLVHYTTQEYFDRIRDSWNLTARQQIASICLTYLSFRNFNNGSRSSDADLEARLAQYPFFDYAARHWGDHAKSVEAQVSEVARGFLQDDGLLLSAVQVMSMSGYQYFGYSQNFSKQTTGLHLTARFGLLHLSELWLLHSENAIGKDADSKDNEGRTPLSCAAAGGHEAVVKLLVERDDVDADSKDEHGRTPLSCAAAGGHEAVVKLLVERDDVDADSVEYHSCEA
jgi:hypothetical protein